ncbi:MAG: methyltransferase domain-containing protein [Oscillospiraceae bacterium]|nr:methyltransferase domain-containing protein [Oscillospiraceae bacterium]
MSLFRCPICAAPLRREDRSYRCQKGHSYDRAKEGYVHLLPANKKHSKNPGDDKGMAAARNRFLSGDWYLCLRRTLESLAAETPGQRLTLLDSGCGEGYYTQGMARALKEQGRTAAVCGVDLSKTSVRYAAKRLPEGEFAVASVYHLPIGTDSIDLLVNCFSPLALEEFSRVLKKGGHFLYVVPGPRHLWEMKEVLYEQPYPNEELSPDYPGFERLKVVKVEEKITLPDSQTIMDLFQMTPYYWKTPASGTARLAKLEQLDLTISFAVHVYRRL